MSIHYRYTELNGEFGCEYIFEKAEEFLPSHQHPPHLRHATRCIRGRIGLETGNERRVIRAGEELSEPAWDSTKPHTLSALEDGTVIFNRLLERPDEAVVADFLSDPGAIVEIP